MSPDQCISQRNSLVSKGTCLLALVISRLCEIALPKSGVIHTTQFILVLNCYTACCTVILPHLRHTVSVGLLLFEISGSWISGILIDMVLGAQNNGQQVVVL